MFQIKMTVQILKSFTSEKTHQLLVNDMFIYVDCVFIYGYHSPYTVYILIVVRLCCYELMVIGFSVSVTKIKHSVKRKVNVSLQKQG